MKERPILFSTPMVQAIQSGIKTKTTRIVKGTPLKWLDDDGFDLEFVADKLNGLSPYGYPGDSLWIRETIMDLRPNFFTETGNQIIYKTESDHYKNLIAAAKEKGKKWKPSIHMPRAAARLFLEVISITIERLNVISREDAIAEGVRFDKDSGYYFVADNIMDPTAEMAFEKLWSQINGADSWEANPWVWVIEFKKITVNNR